MKKLLALVLVLCMALPAAFATEGAESIYVYKDAVSQLSSNWNPHTYQTTDESYPIDFITAGLYSFIYNDELHPLEGKDPYTGYVIVPEMAAAKPVDVTEQVKAEHPEFNIPAEMTKGYAYVIDLNPDAKWDDGTPINAETYVESMKRLLDPKLINYRASDYYDGDLAIAGAKAFANGGQIVAADTLGAYALADLTKKEDGTYWTSEGDQVFLGVNFPLDWTSGNTLKDYVDAYGDGYFSMTNWETLVGMMDEEGLIALTDENLALYADVVNGNPAWGETEADLPNYFVTRHEWPVTDWSTVGLFATGEHQITLVLEKSLTGFYLLYNLSGNWLVKPDLYDACLTQDGDAWFNTYNTTVETSASYGPYKMTYFETDKAMTFERNENWYGYSDGKHVYVDPVDGETYDMYMTDKIECQVVAEAATRKLMFLKGQLMGYGLQSEDFATYRNSDYVYFTPSETIFFMILNGHKEAIKEREANEGFDKNLYDLESLTLLNFRKAMGVTYDKELFASTISPARSGGYGLIGNNYIYDPETGARYRDTDQAKKALCDFYSVDVSKYASLDEAVDSITGYDPVAAKELFTLAYQDAIAAGYITDADNNGISDQTVRIEYCSSTTSPFIEKTVAYMTEKLGEVIAGTPWEGKIEFYISADYGNEWSNKIREGMSDTVLGGWSGSALNPFGLTDLYVNPSRAYDANWFNANTETLEIVVPVDGVDTAVTLTLYQWSDALNGMAVEVDGKTYNFGADQADVETRLNILAAFEAKVLGTYDYLPMLQDASAALLSQQVYYVIEEYNPIMGRGGMTYMKYNYDETEWAAYVASQNDGQLSY